jgi:transcriptional regulator with XRE-family HTH domain
MEADSRRETANERLGVNVRTLREQKHMSQAELARQMTERGWPWHQSTVYRVESGRQTVSFAEALELAAILQTSLDRFTWTGPEASATEMVYDAGAQLRKRYEQVAHAVFVLLLGHDRADRTLAQSEDSKYERVQEARRDVAERMGTYSLEAAIDEGCRRYEERDTEAGGGEGEASTAEDQAHAPADGALAGGDGA